MGRLASRRSKGLAGLVLALLPCSAAGGDPEPVRPPVVKAVHWRGVEALSRKELAAHVFTPTPSWKPWVGKPEFSRATLDRDLERIVGLYRRYGYYEARAEHALEWDRERRRVEVTFRVDEGLPVRVAALAVALPASGPAAAVRTDDLPLRPGDVFSLRAYGAAKQELLARLANVGFPRARVEGGAVVDAPAREARVDWRVETGPPVRFGSTSVSGLGEVEEPLVRREVSVAEGEAFSLDALRTTREQVQGLGLFRSVIVQPNPPPETGEGEASQEQTWPVEVRVQERPLRSVRVGIGWGTEDRFRSQLSWMHRNFLGEARRLELGARYSDLLVGFDASLEQPRFLDPKLLLRADASLRRESEPSYDADRVLTRLELRRPLSKTWTARVGYQFEWNDIEDVSADATRALEDPEQSLVLSFFELGLRRSTLDDAFSPQRGTRLDVSVEPSLRAIGSAVGYLKTVVEGRGFVPLGPGVLGGRLRIGTLDPMGSTASEEIPVVKRFYSGGSNSVRGFDFQKLGPLDADGDPIGGTSLLEASVEWRFPIWGKLAGVTFVDAGQVDLEPYRWKLDDVFYSTGAGLRYDTPVGPLRVDFGYVLNPPPETGRTRFHLSVGHSF